MKPRKQVARETKQLFRLCLRNGRVDEDRVRLVVHRILESRHRGYLTMLKGLLRLLSTECERHTADIQSATPLPFDLRERVQASLTTIYGPGLAWSFAQNTVLIGGIRIKVGNDVYDSSVRFALVDLARSFGIQNEFAVGT